MMTVKKLIEELQKYPEDSEVVYSYINPMGEDVENEPAPYYNEFSGKIYL